MSKTCTKCVMDTSDPEIFFNEDGVCNHCISFEKLLGTEWFPNNVGKNKLDKIVSKIKHEGKNKKYDCIIGLSGGIDSSYLALKVKELGLRPLVVHVDAGWNSELAVANIESVIKYCDYDLHTQVIDWKDMKKLHLAYLYSGIANQDVPQDHIFFSTLYHFAIKNRIKYIISGGNTSTEGVFPKSWIGTAMDAINLKAIFKKYGKGKLKNYKTISFFQYYFWYPIVLGMRTIRPLNFMEYDKRKALVELEKINYKPYDKKHGESIFTSFFQSYYLPEKFGYDKRKPHLSSLIVSGQLTRIEAIEKMSKPLYSDNELELDIEYVAKKLELSSDDFKKIMSTKKRYYKDFPNWLKYQRFIKKLQSLYLKLFNKKLNIYS
jgi:aminotransferase